jgi:hypothetical protein
MKWIVYTLFVVHSAVYTAGKILSLGRSKLAYRSVMQKITLDLDQYFKKASKRIARQLATSYGKVYEHDLKLFNRLIRK